MPTDSQFRSRFRDRNFDTHLIGFPGIGQPLSHFEAVRKIFRKTLQLDSVQIPRGVSA